MRAILIITFTMFCSTLHSQIKYTGDDAKPDPALELEKKNKEAYFQKLLSDVGIKLVNCEKQCGSYAADANNPKDPCSLQGITPKCICDCRKSYNESKKSIEQEKNNWKATILKREDDYKNKKIKDQQQSDEIKRKTEALNTSQKETDQKYDALKNNETPINNSIQVAGNAIWDITQSSKAGKQASAEGIVSAIRKTMYEIKKDNNYYDNIVCEDCNGSGNLIYNNNPNSILYGQKHQCKICNGIGRRYKIKTLYNITPYNTYSKEAVDLWQYISDNRSKIIPLIKLYPAGYNGYTEFFINVSIKGHYDDLRMEVFTFPHFYKRNGKEDLNVITDDIYENKIFPLKIIQGFVFVKGESKIVDGSTWVTSDHITLVGSNGETFDFTTDKNPSIVVDKLNDLLNNLKTNTKHLDNSSSSNENNQSNSNQDLSSSSTDLTSLDANTNWVISFVKTHAKKVGLQSSHYSPLSTFKKLSIVNQNGKVVFVFEDVGNSNENIKTFYFIYLDQLEDWGFNIMNEILLNGSKILATRKGIDNSHYTTELVYLNSASILIDQEMDDFIVEMDQALKKFVSLIKK